MGKSVFGTALVFGGCGSLGSHIVEALHSDDSFSTVIVASRNPTRPRIGGTHYKNCDVTDRAQIQTLLDEIKPQIIFHSVAPDSNASEKTQYRVNYLSTEQLLEIAREHAAVRAFIYTSSARAIASESHTRSKPLTEEVAVLHDLSSSGSPYERTKGAADALTQAMNTGNARRVSNNFEGILLTAVIRVPALYGRRDLRTSGRIIQRANTRATRLQLGSNSAKHEWLYLDNAAYAHVLAAKALLDGRHNAPNTRVDGEAFFVTDGEPVKFWDFSRKLWTATGDHSCTDSSKVIEIPMWAAIALATMTHWLLWIFTLGKAKSNLSGHQLHYIDRGSWWSIDKARERLGYEPIYGTDEGIRRTVDWFHHHKAK